MCINIISTAPWSPWQTRGNSPFTNEESQPPRLQCVEEVVRLSKLETAHVSAQGIEDRGHRPQWLESCLQRHLHCSIYNI